MRQVFACRGHRDRLPKFANNRDEIKEPILPDGTAFTPLPSRATSSARVVCRFSCGAASAVATKLALGAYGPSRIEISYCDPGSEHPDNRRFLADCERWFGKSVTILKSEKYSDTWAVWRDRRFITSAKGAPCTGELKREPWYAMERPTDILVLGYTVEEQDRADSLRKQNFERIVETPLIEARLTKADCLAMIQRAGIELPMMYRLGYHNNNCIGCPKGGMGYWNKIRKDFPEVYERMAALQRTLGPGASFLRDRAGGRNERVSLDQLRPDQGNYVSEPNVECSVMCHAAEAEIESDNNSDET